ncbi:MAG: efflux RND transporter periplasmic adaptor subunit [Bacteroidota bacterium]|nr:efflux RND transporter periplasmic adaptor subunit [Bacteroidota bacterium]
MKTIFIISIALLTLTWSCTKQENKPAPTPTITENDPIVKDGGKWIEFPQGSTEVKIFNSVTIDNKSCLLNFSAPATVIGKVHHSTGSHGRHLILFDSPEITGVYSSYLQNLTLAKTAKINFNRVNDLYKHGAATGKELNDASAELLNIQTSLAENEARLRESGLNPENLNSAPTGTVWLICDLPESELNTIKRGQKYKLSFPSFPNETFSANIDVIADVMNTQTRKIKLRLSLFDKENKIRPGMYAVVQFESMHKGLMVPKKSVISANARYYVFIKHSDYQYERREVTVSSETGDYIEIATGIKPGDNVVSENVYLLKGIDLGI